MRANGFVREVSAAVIFIFVVSIPSTAAAITISVTSISTNPGDSGFQDAFWSDYESDSATSIVNAGGSTADSVGNDVSARTRYAQYAWADNTSGSTTHEPTSDYRVIMHITSVAGTVYDLDIDTTRLGALTLYDDSTFYSTVYSSASIGAVTAKVGGFAETALSLDAVTANISPLNVAINQASSTFTIAGLEGDFQLVLDFEWTSSVFSNNDEGALRLGLDTSTVAASGVTADDYPGTGARTMADDGHFVDVTATVVTVAGPVPEPSTGLLLALGLCGLSASRARSSSKR